MNKLFTLFVCLLIANATATVVAQTTITLTPEKDNTLFESATGTLSAGADQNLFAGRTGFTAGGLIRRAVMMFDIASNIPAGSVINDVTLTLQSTLATAGTDNFSLHTLQADWGEGGSTGTGSGGGQGGPSQTGDATWIHTFYDTDFWSTPGGDFNSTASATTPVSTTGSYDWFSAQLTADVQFWLDNPTSNFGWILIGDETMNQTAKRFASRENATIGIMPRLEITFSAPCTAPDVPQINAGTTTICAGSPVSINVTGNLNDATEWVLYSGSCGGSLISSNSSGNFMVNPTADIDYFIRGEGGCVTPGTCASVSISVTSVDTSVSQSSTTLTANLAGATYQWVDCNNNFAAIGGETSQSFTPLVNGNYAVILEENGCIDTSSCRNVIVVSINEISTTAFNVFPNPFVDELLVELLEKNSNSLRIELLNSLGKVVLVTDLLSGEKTKTADLVDGIYLIRISEKKNNTILGEKIVIKK